MNLKTKLGDWQLDNPIIPASGTFGFGYEFSNFYDINKLGSFSTKGTTLEEKFGNERSRIAESYSGIINSIGLQNPGVDRVVSEEFIKLKKVYNKKVIANIGGHDIDSYVECVKKIQDEDIVEIIELNVSCPNVNHGGMQCGSDELILRETVRAVRKICKKKLYIKLTPNVTNICELAKICEEEKADGIVLINTLSAMRVDIYISKPIIKKEKGGLSGPAIFPIALRNVYDVYKVVDIPIIGVGGITCAKDVIEMMMCGASAVQIGSQNLIHPTVCSDIIDELPNILKEINVTNITDIIGSAHE